MTDIYLPLGDNERKEKKKKKKIAVGCFSVKTLFAYI